MRTFQLNELLTNSEWLLGTNIFAIFHCDAFLRRNHSSARREPIKFKMFLAFTDFCVWRDAFSDLQKGEGAWTIWQFGKSDFFNSFFQSFPLPHWKHQTDTKSGLWGYTQTGFNKTHMRLSYRDIQFSCIQ